jgi:hypothetical protein
MGADEYQADMVAFRAGHRGRESNASFRKIRLPLLKLGRSSRSNRKSEPPESVRSAVTVVVKRLPCRNFELRYLNLRSCPRSLFVESSFRRWSGLSQRNLLIVVTQSSSMIRKSGRLVTRSLERIQMEALRCFSVRSEKAARTGNCPTKSCMKGPPVKKRNEYPQRDGSRIQRRSFPSAHFGRFDE